MYLCLELLKLPESSPNIISTSSDLRPKRILDILNKQIKEWIHTYDKKRPRQWAALQDTIQNNKDELLHPPYRALLFLYRDLIASRRPSGVLMWIKTKSSHSCPTEGKAAA